MPKRSAAAFSPAAATRKASERPSDAPSVPPPAASQPFVPQRVETTTDADRAATARLEWLLTGGLGDFAMGTAAGVPARRYHGLLVAATTPPVGRVVVVNQTVDRLLILRGSAEAVCELSSFRFEGLGADRLHPDGLSRLSGFERTAHAAIWRYDTPYARITKSLQMIDGRGAAVLTYEIERLPGSNGSAPGLRLCCRPLMALRNFHHTTRRAWGANISVDAATPQSVTVRRDALVASIASDAARFDLDPQWWSDFRYNEDAARGQEHTEDLFAPGEFCFELAPHAPRGRFIVRMNLGAASIPDEGELRESESRRAARLDRALSAAGAGLPGPDTPLAVERLAALVAASDAFIVRRDHAGKSSSSIIAGYPWFSDWGRDALISLPGLLIATGRFDDARAALATFAAHRRRGIVPNVFNDDTGEPEYNTVDGSLWFLHAACAYLESSGDRGFWSTTLAPACFDIVHHYRTGTDFNIAMDPADHLISAGTSATQLTWMDARRDGVVFTPRHGKAVEINALWATALMRLAGATSTTDGARSADLRSLAGAAAASFRNQFWNAQTGCLYDCLTPAEHSGSHGVSRWIADPAIRPNQVLAVSLPFSPLTPAQQASVVDVVMNRLCTPRGVRTLDPAHRAYKARYQGNLFERDGAYHQGTAWPWLLGPLAEAVLRAGLFSPESRRRALTVLEPLLETLAPDLAATAREPRSCLGQIAEIYDGDAPQRPQGCPAQAWSIAEILRAWLLARRGA